MCEMFLLTELERSGYLRRLCAFQFANVFGLRDKKCTMFVRTWNVI